MDLADRSLLVALCAPLVPCGAAAREALRELAEHGFGIAAGPQPQPS